MFGPEVGFWETGLLDCGCITGNPEPASTISSSYSAPNDQLFSLDTIGVRAYSIAMRYSLEHKAQNHENILSVAARSFREHGGDSSGIGTVMKKVGLTKGGFYRHFKSKDDLFVEAVARAFDEMGRAWWRLQSPRPKVRLCGPSSNAI